jgi:hypothetical protein
MAFRAAMTLRSRAPFLRLRAKERRATGLGVAAFACALSASGDVPRIQVRGVARIDVHAARSSGKTVLSGLVTDDRAVPVAEGFVSLTVAPRADSEATTPEADGGWTGSAMSARSVEPCAMAGDRAVFGSSGELVLPIDAQSRFCVRLSLPLGNYVAHLEVRRSAFLDGTRVNLPLDPARKAVTLGFDPEPTILDLDGDAISIGVIATTEDDGEVSAAPGLLLEVSNEGDVTLERAMTNASGIAQFHIANAALGRPGRGELRVSFSGNTDSGVSSHTAFVERRTRVHVEGASVTDRETATMLVQDLMTVDVMATAACAAHGCSASPTGSVELYLGETLLGAAPIASRRARVAAALPSGLDRRSQARLRLHYVADASWFVPGGDVFLPRQDPSTSAWGEILVALAGLLVAGWVVAARLPRKDLALFADAAKGPQVPPRAGLRVLRECPTSRAILGRVVDAHGGEPVALANVRLERTGFDGTEVVSRVTCDPDGRFELPGLGGRPGDEVVVDSRQYCTLRSPIAAHGEIEIALVHRRRRLLDDLVVWARRRGGRFDARPEPTPAHVRRAADAEPLVADWADALERAVYGSAVVDEQLESEVTRLAPPTAGALPLHGDPNRRAGRRKGT